MSDFQGGLCAATLVCIGILFMVLTLRDLRTVREHNSIDTKIVITQKYDDDIEKANVISNVFEIFKLNDCIVNSVEECSYNKKFVKIIGSKSAKPTKLTED